MQAGDRLWRVMFVLAALLLFAGGPRHPGGTMAEMLGNPEWLPAHALLLAGFVAFLGGVTLWRRSRPLAGRSAQWGRIALFAVALQVIEMASHLASYIDHDNLVAGKATPVLSIHLVLAVIAYPCFGIAMIGLIIATMRDRTLGSPWIGWLGILGSLAQAASTPLVVVFHVEGARRLFPMLLFLALWMVLAGAWPRQDTAGG